MPVWTAIGGVSALLTVLIGAFAAHGLEARLDEKALGWIDTAVRYQMFHALALIALGILGRAQERSLDITLAGYAFTLGTLLFCGLLYAMALGAPRVFGAVVPVGGLAFMVGWVFFIRYAWRAMG
ncbi:MAG: DUF423 domain-containing protein [Pseudomonadota bacterium]